MKGKSNQTKSGQSSLQSEHFDAQKADLDTEMYLKENIKHVYADGETPRVSFKKDGELKYSLRKIRSLHERFSKKDFLDRSRKETQQDLKDLRNYISSTCERVNGLSPVFPF